MLCAAIELSYRGCSCALMLAAGSADLGCAAEEEQLGEGPCNAGAAGEESRNPNLGVIRFKAHKLMGAQPHGSHGLPGCHS